MPKSEILRFGIPSLDQLFGGSDSRFGMLLPDIKKNARLNSSVSLCISGPDGTGKSVLGLHLASRYAADCCDSSQTIPKVLYVSTDLKFKMAEKIWVNFGLDCPNERKIPFAFGKPSTFGEQEGAKHEALRLILTNCAPLGGTSSDSEPLSDKLHSPHEPLDEKKPELEILFVDLASKTAGDDWGFVNRVLSVLEEPAEGQPRHLMVVDSVEGFETLVGERDAFGETQPRRSRIAQIMRAAADKCHTLLIVEEPEEGKHLPEEFVTDAVLRLRRSVIKGYVRRTLEVEKVRGHSHIRGQHAYLIRSGSGSTTGLNENYDDPAIPAVKGNGDDKTEPKHQSYLHVCHSLHTLSREVMALQGTGRPDKLGARWAAFGIRHLDDMLEIGKEIPKREKGNDWRGLQCSTVTALIGNSETKKSPLGYAFLARCFREYAKRFCDFLVEGSDGEEPEEKWTADDENLRRPYTNQERRSRVSYRLNNARVSADADERKKNGDYGDINIKRNEAEQDWKTEIDDKVKRACRKLGSPKSPKDGIPVLLTTKDIHAHELVRNFLPWLLHEVPRLRALEADHHGCLAALRILLEEYTICRRLEIHDLPSSVLIHIVQQAVGAAQCILHESNVGETTEKRFNQSWGIRVVIDDFSILRNTYIEVRDEPLLLRYLVFYLGREGVTTLLIDTQSGRPDTTVASPLDSELRSLVNNSIYTWRFSFFGEDRVAIAPIPPIAHNRPAVVRELREGKRVDSESEVTPLIVDPHFELYSGIEKGEPQPVPLEIRLFEETENFKNYIDDENATFREMFTAASTNGNGEGRDVIIGVPPGEYNRLRDFCYLQRDTRLNHTLIFQVDEFWYLRRSGVRRSGAFRLQWEYLNAITAYKFGNNWIRDWANDPFGLFQKTLSDKQREPANKTHRRRREEFKVKGYRRPKNKKDGDLVDRVPFMWDFGFLLCNQRQWEKSGEAKIPVWKKRGTKLRLDKSLTVKTVWDRLPKALESKNEKSNHPSWREFLGACYQVARAESYRRGEPVPAFDCHVVAAQTFSCLVLEIWASEIYQKKKKENQLDEFLKQVTIGDWNLSSTTSEQNDTPGLIGWLKDYKLELFKAWLLLVEVLDLSGLSSVIRQGNMRARQANPNAPAIRHWYKTACRATEEVSLTDPIIPVSLPGHFSVRGDWFLAVAGGSRSNRLADRALDLLNSRRANHARLRNGMGLPVRSIPEEKKLRTALQILDQGSNLRDMAEEAEMRVRNVQYGNLLKIGGGEYKEESQNLFEFYWFWRSGLKRYYRHAKIWQEWLSNMIFWWARLRYLERDNWVNGFERYDGINIFGEAYLTGNPDLPAWRIFQEQCDALGADLAKATTRDER